jgi:hypothetical protein
MEIIVPAAGLSTRFPGTRPKYLLYDYSGTLMLRKALEPFIGKYNITIGILHQHAIQYDAVKIINREVGNVNIVVIDQPTKGPAETVYRILNKFEKDVEFLVKDCDNFFDINYITGNVIYTSDIRHHETLRKLASKSFVTLNSQGLVLGIVEKEIVSNYFCIGAYKFESSNQYKQAYDAILKNSNKEIFVSHIISYMLDNNVVFLNKDIIDFVDAGTLEDWNKYNYKPTIFCDIDGTLVKSMHRPYDGEYEVLKNNYSVIKREYDRGCQIIFTTARPSSAEAVTSIMLQQLGFVNCKLIMGLHNAPRILINDYHPTNKYPSALSFNVKRDEDDLGELYHEQAN